jgi:ADP-heptose:LPS heptosyltransferase
MSKNDHILILRFSALGDIAITVPLLRVLFLTYPNLKLTIVSRKKVLPIFKEFKRLNFLQVDFSNKHKGFKGLWRLFKEIRPLKITAIADLHAVIRTYVLGFFFQLHFYKVKRIDKGKREKKALIRQKNKIFKPLLSSIYRYADVFRKLGYPVDLKNHEFPDRLKLPKILLQNILKSEKPFIGIAPFASHQGKIYPLDLMQKVIGFLERDYQIFLFGFGEKETFKLKIWDEAFKNVFNCSESFDFENQLKLISNLNLMISMDSANGHLAANAGVPVITIWGMTHPFLGFTPFLQPGINQIMIDRNKFLKIPSSVYGNKIPIGYEDAFRSISPLSIIEMATGLLKIKHHHNQ